jgi:hypothetical protein
LSCKTTSQHFVQPQWFLLSPLSAFIICFDW